MQDRRKKLGNFGEDLATSFLKRKGYRIIDRNFRTKFGEIDIICEKQGKIVFVEVRTKSNDTFGIPEESINARKKQKLALMADFYLTAKKLWEKPYSLDGVFIEEKNGEYEIRHLEDMLG